MTTEHLRRKILAAGAVGPTRRWAATAPAVPYHSPVAQQGRRRGNIAVVAGCGRHNDGSKHHLRRFFNGEPKRSNYHGLRSKATSICCFSATWCENAPWRDVFPNYFTGCDLPPFKSTWHASRHRACISGFRIREVGSLASALPPLISHRSDPENDSASDRLSPNHLENPRWHSQPNPSVIKRMKRLWN